MSMRMRVGGKKGNKPEVKMTVSEVTLKVPEEKVKEMLAMKTEEQAVREMITAPPAPVTTQEVFSAVANREITPEQGAAILSPEKPSLWDRLKKVVTK